MSTNTTANTARAKYRVLVQGAILSAHRTAAAAVKAARAEVRRQGLVDDGAYCSMDGWPAIVNSKNPAERIEY